MAADAFASVSESEKERAFDTIVLAFASDPVERWLYPQAHHYLASFPALVAAFGGGAFAQGMVWRVGDFSAVALWFAPGVEADGDAIVAVLADTVAPAQHEDTFAVVAQMDEAHPRFPHWYLPWLGVDPAVQGQGLGSELLTHCLRIVDEDHLPAYLETPNPRTVPFYERHGFEVTAEAQAGACPPIACMLRLAR
jgi:ribosomal protein S18 acetylase RimI-like enzyme